VVSDRELFRQAFRRWATTVVVVTYRDDEDRPVGMTATSMSSLSVDPPSLLVCINRETRAHPVITKRGAFGIDMLSIGQRPIADHCSAAGRDKLLQAGWLASDELEAGHPGEAVASPRLADSLAHLDCSMDRSYEAFSHTIMIGLIRSVWINPRDLPPLLYHGGVYTQMETPAERAERFHWDLGGE
jgi:3-hydroxy-9,10-secoandrosta-1,3,5(10)-triene-9,17-dione monooxygenase reductase component